MLLQQAKSEKEKFLGYQPILHITAKNIPDGHADDAPDDPGDVQGDEVEDDADGGEHDADDGDDPGKRNKKHHNFKSILFRGTKSEICSGTAVITFFAADLVWAGEIDTRVTRDPHVFLLQFFGGDFCSILYLSLSHSLCVCGEFYYFQLYSWLTTR